MGVFFLKGFDLSKDKGGAFNGILVLSPIMNQGHDQWNSPKISILQKILYKIFTSFMYIFGKLKIKFYLYFFESTITKPTLAL